MEQAWREAAQVREKTRLQLRSAAGGSLRFLTSSPPAGTACEFLVNTSKAGPGALAVTIDGPSKVKMDCVECPEGYRVTYTPMAPGSYLISIKYGGPYHIVGSPFKARISGESSRSPVAEQHQPDLETTLSPGSKLVSSHSAHETSSVTVDPLTRAISCSTPAAPSQSDASKVLAKGLGLNKAFIGQKNSFSVDCSKAGAWGWGAITTPATP